MRRRLITAAAIAATSIGVGVVPAGAQPSPSASCVAQLGPHGPLGNPGEHQRVERGDTTLGEGVAFVALADDCGFFLD